MGRVMLERPYLEHTRAKGRDYYYYRRNGRRVSLPAPTDPTFGMKYDGVHARFEAAARKGEPAKPIAKGSFAALVAEFKQSPDFRQKARSTRRDYAWHLTKMEAMWGDLGAFDVSRRAIFAYRKLIADDGHARQANYAVSVARLLYNFAEDAEFPGMPKHFKNPARRPKRLKEGKGFIAWPLPVMERYCETFKDDPTRMLAFLLGLMAGQPRGDAIARNRTHWNGTDLVAARTKTGEPIWVLAMPPLKAAIDSVLAGRFMFLQTDGGRPFTERSFSRWFREGLDLAGIGKEFHYHGLRVTAAEILSEFCDDATLQAIFGWKTAAMAQHYRRNASKKKAAHRGMALWEQTLAGLPNALLPAPKLLPNSGSGKP
jgi:hypothetical protein